MKSFARRIPQLVLGVLFALALAAPASAQLSTVNPSSLDLTLGAGDMIGEMLSITINPLCVRPFLIDVAASDPGAIVSNQTGVLLNGCGGDTSTFTVEFTGTGAFQAFDLQFVDSEFGGVLDEIPVTISVAAEPASLGMLGTVGLSAIAYARRRRAWAWPTGANGAEPAA